MIDRDRFRRLMKATDIVSRKLTGERDRITTPRLFVLMVVCDARKASASTIQHAARTLPPKLAEHGLHRLVHGKRAREVLRDLWSYGLLSREEPHAGGRLSYSATSRTRRHLTSLARTNRRGSRTPQKARPHELRERPSAA